uniref:Histone deacetylase complex subunit SAP18 n=1 Tax=Oryza glumipatula TaxID=40148 RepID=A0A0D9YLH9_9ORYZ
MAGRGEMPMRPVRPGPPMQYRGPPPMARARVEPVDREKTCPLLLRVFTKVGGHHQNEEFAVRGKEPKDEVQIYTWKDATLRELTDLVKEVALAARKRNARLSFAFVYPDKHGRFVVKEVGSTFSYGHGRGDDAKTLAELGFQVKLREEYQRQMHYLQDEMPMHEQLLGFGKQSEGIIVLTLIWQV